MSAPQSGGGDLNAAFQAFSNEVFEATQRLLRAQHQLTQEIVGAAAQTGAGGSARQAGGGDSDTSTDEQAVADQAEPDLSEENAADEDVNDEESGEEDLGDEDELGDENPDGEEDLGEDELSDEDEGEAASDELDEGDSSDVNDEYPADDERDEDEGVPAVVSSARGRSGRGRRG
jgi:hypothetical protein